MELLSVDRSKYTFIEADDKNFRYMGRIDFANKKAPTFIYAGSTVITKFKGTSVKIVIKNNRSRKKNYIGYILDRKVLGKILITKNNKEIVVNVMDGLKDQEHEILIFKREDSRHYFEFLGLVLDRGCTISSAGYKSNRRIEVFGDSIAAGELSEWEGTVDKKNESLKSCFSNAGYAFPIMLSTYLQAELNNNAQSGLDILNNTGTFRNKKPLGLEFTYDKLRCNPELGECTDWDFNLYIPHVVIFEFGNLQYANNSRINIEEWKAKLEEIIQSLREKYEKAYFILITSILEHNDIWDNAMDEVQEELGDQKVLRYKFIRNGCGPSDYLKFTHQSEMAQELTEFINSLGDKVWE